MANEEHYITIYTGSEVNVQHLQNIFEEQGINSLAKNNFESGLRSGFGGGLPGQVQLQVQENQSEQARKIVEDTFPPKPEDKEDTDAS